MLSRGGRRERSSKKKPPAAAESIGRRRRKYVWPRCLPSPSVRPESRTPGWLQHLFQSNRMCSAAPGTSTSKAWSRRARSITLRQLAIFPSRNEAAMDTLSASFSETQVLLLAQQQIALALCRSPAPENVRWASESTGRCCARRRRPSAPG